MTLQTQERYRDVGLLVIRVGIGLSFVGYGMPKLLGGPPMWEDVGRAMTYLGITFAPRLWGFAAAVSEVLGGAALVAGVVFRPAAFFLVCTMIVATVQHFGRGDGYAGGGFHSIEFGVVSLGLLLMGPGRYGLARLWSRSKDPAGRPSP